MAAANQTILDGQRNAVFKFTNVFDAASDEAAVVKIDVSALSGSRDNQPCTGVAINKVWAMTSGVAVDILWDATVDVLALRIPVNEDIDWDFSCFNGLPNNAGAGVTGDVEFTTVGAAAGDSYTIVLECIKKYD